MRKIGPANFRGLGFETISEAFEATAAETIRYKTAEIVAELAANDSWPSEIARRNNVTVEVVRAIALGDRSTVPFRMCTECAGTGAQKGRGALCKACNGIGHHG